MTLFLGYTYFGMFGKQKSLARPSSSQPIGHWKYHTCNNDNGGRNYMQTKKSRNWYKMFKK
jgi:hypothetical protein